MSVSRHESVELKEEAYKFGLALEHLVEARRLFHLGSALAVKRLDLREVSLDGAD
jgi:hypothetical protein